MKGRRVRIKKLTRVALALFLLCCASWATATRTTIATAVAQKVAAREAPAQKATFPEVWRAASRSWRPAIEKLGNGSDKLRRSERLFHKDAIRNAP